jgi:hypothetical protein
MDTIAIDLEDPASRWRLPAGWFLVAAGLAAVSWWVWTWSRVHNLITEHVAAHGSLPGSPMDRAALYVNGTGPEQQLSSDLASMPGLYPWGWLPLVLAVAVGLLGWFVAVPRTRRTVAVGVGASVLLLVVLMAWLGETTTIALDILE